MKKKNLNSEVYKNKNTKRSELAMDGGFTAFVNYAEQVLLSM